MKVNGVRYGRKVLSSEEVRPRREESHAGNPGKRRATEPREIVQQDGVWAASGHRAGEKQDKEVKKQTTEQGETLGQDGGFWGRARPVSLSTALPCNNHTVSPRLK